MNCNTTPRAIPLPGAIEENITIAVIENGVARPMRAGDKIPACYLPAAPPPVVTGAAILAALAALTPAEIAAIPGC